MSAEDEAFVCRFDQFFHQGKGFTNDQDKLSTELKRTSLDTEPTVGTPGGPFSGPTINNHSATDQSSIDRSTQIIKGQPTKALDDAVYAAAQLLHDRPRSRRKIIVLISDGVNGGKKFNKFTFDQVVNVLWPTISPFTASPSKALISNARFPPSIATARRSSAMRTIPAAKSITPKKNTVSRSSIPPHRGSPQPVHLGLRAPRHRPRRRLSHHRSPRKTRRAQHQDPRRLLHRAIPAANPHKGSEPVSEDTETAG